ncbi:hypothetical protein FRX31_027680, partial [Thalictrum thalictroides]
PFFIPLFFSNSLTTSKFFFPSSSLSHEEVADITRHPTALQVTTAENFKHFLYELGETVKSLRFLILRTPYDTLSSPFENHLTNCPTSSFSLSLHVINVAEEISILPFKGVC